MPKDNENIPFLGPIEPSEPQGFSAEQMIRCEECLRANPPTRVSCLYCVAPLPVTESSARLRKPVLRQPEKHQPGYNNILIPIRRALPDEIVNETAALLKLSPENVQALMSQSVPMPVARTASREEAELVTERLARLGLTCTILSDQDLGLLFSDNTVKRVRAMRFDDQLLAIQLAGGEEIELSWADVILILPGRLIETRVEIQERLTRKPEKELLDTSEFFRDEAVIDFYAATQPFTWRVGASGFDFSCLKSEKALIVNENITRLQRLLVANAVNARFDDSYPRVRNLLEFAWSTQQETESSGWRRDRPGKLSVGLAMVKSNETQFTRYSRLRYHFVNSES
ncbi:MAG TPA: hypothetical protein VGQ41_07170 [Pyrinomonadaceae bacterium]|nr:hypothetical protein [Pyrinomonadaceae bacterium]